MGKGQDLYKRAKKIIPGGTMLLSKRPEMHLPENWPAYYSKAKGCEVWNLEGKKYIDASSIDVGKLVTLMITNTFFIDYIPLKIYREKTSKVARDAY